MTSLEQKYLNRIRELSEDMFRKDKIIDNLQKLIDEQEEKFESVEESMYNAFEEVGLLQMFLQSQGYSQSDIEEFKTHRGML